MESEKTTVRLIPDGSRVVGPFDSYIEAMAAAAGVMAGRGAVGDATPDNPEFRRLAWPYAETLETVRWFCYVTAFPPGPAEDASELAELKVRVATAGLQTANQAMAALRPQAVAPAPKPADANALFEAMTPADRRRAVAVDVLTRLGSVCLSTGNYLQWRGPGRDEVVLKSDRLCAVADRVESQCSVCLLGGLILSTARVFDRVGRAEVIRPLGDAVDSGFAPVDAKRLLADTFPPDQLSLLECAFELSSARAHALGESAERGMDAAVDAFLNGGVDPEDRVRYVLGRVVASPDALYDPPPHAYRVSYGTLEKARVESDVIGSRRVTVLKERLRAAAGPDAAG